MNIAGHSIEDFAASLTSRFDLWCRVIRAHDVRTMLEIGVWRGEFAEHILSECAFIDRYYMIDPWAHLEDWNKPYNQSQDILDGIFAEAMERTGFASHKIVVLKGRTKEVIDSIPDNSLDFAYIDGDHTLRGITIDLIKLLPKMKKNGLIGGDDFLNTPWQHDSRFEPTLVCPFSIYFAEAMNLPIVALPFNQFLIENTAAGFFFHDTTGAFGNISLNKLRDIPRVFSD